MEISFLFNTCYNVLFKTHLKIHLQLVKITKTIYLFIKIKIILLKFSY